MQRFALALNGPPTSGRWDWTPLISQSLSWITSFQNNYFFYIFIGVSVESLVHNSLCSVLSRILFIAICLHNCSRLGLKLPYIEMKCLSGEKLSIG